jgi:hypothetical protein
MKGDATVSVWHCAPVTSCAPGHASRERIEKLHPVSFRIRGGQAIMLHVRSLPYVVSLLLLIPSVIVTLRVLEARKGKPESKNRTKKKDSHAILNMNGIAGTCLSSSLPPAQEHVERPSDDAESTGKQRHRILRQGSLLIFASRRRPVPARSSQRFPAKLQCSGISTQLTADLT